MRFTTYFSAGRIDRESHRRSSEDFEALQSDPAARFLVFHDSRCLIEDGAAVLLERETAGIERPSREVIYLGRREGTPLFAVSLPTLPPDGPLDERRFESSRALLGGVNDADAALLAYAKGMIEWQQRHLHCGRCGAPNRPGQGGFVMSCSNTDCGERCFPRVDPVVIVLATEGERCLLGRQATWPERRFSTIAGFAEPGEALDEAVRREVREETAVELGEVRYLGSQPWPFPTGLMIGFHAEAESTRIERIDGELAEAGWFTREELAGGAVVLPPAESIAFRLVEAWFDEWDGPGLASLGLSGNFSRSAGDAPVEEDEDGP